MYQIYIMRMWCVCVCTCACMHAPPFLQPEYKLLKGRASLSIIYYLLSRPPDLPITPKAQQQSLPIADHSGFR